ncbi:hypothetical protein B0H63DRAFT_125685 [Podospora didyma]|uniref:MOSC domain-containing protein n=1 Tax=Podospora didyma TaxID=330526 RepID=A0AAE0P0B3_9PEZI|nr:hypothetical protein B0H63DRAFT_125685 [Podospora didyma]
MDEDTVLRSVTATIDASGVFLVFITLCVFLLPVFLIFPPVPPSKRDALLQTHSSVSLTRSGLETNVSPDKSSQVSPGTIRSLWIYPVKSCKGIEVGQSKVLPTGLEFDRIYTFAQLKSRFPVSLDASDEEKSEHKWEFITQRKYPLLATVQVDLYVPDISKSRAQPQLSKSGDVFIVVHFPWREAGFRGVLQWIAAKLARGRHAVPEKEIVLPAAFPPQQEIEERGYTYEPVTIWKDTIMALNMEADLPRELAPYLGVSNRLGIFRVDPARLRQVFRCAPTKADAGYQPLTGFQDAYPLHLLNLSSLRDLDAKIQKDDNLRNLDPRRFRANIIIDGLSAYDEETWKTLRFTPGPSSRHQPSRFHVSCRTVRCKLPNVDPDNGVRHPVEPDKALRKFRDVDEGAKYKGCLGMQLTPLFDKMQSPDDLESYVEVGMFVDILDRGTHVYISQ